MDKKGLNTIGCLITLLPAIVFFYMIFSGFDIGPVEGTIMWLIFFLGIWLINLASSEQESTANQPQEILSGFQNEFSKNKKPAIISSIIKKNMMDKKSILNYGFGSPGETARVMTKEFIRLKDEENIDNERSCFIILSNRAQIYNSMKSNMLDDYLVSQIVSKSNGKLPIIILADIFITNKAQGKNHIWALLAHLDDVIEVVFENYNSLVSMTEKLSPNPDFRNDIDELFEYLYAYRSY